MLTWKKRQTKARPKEVSQLVCAKAAVVCFFELGRMSSLALVARPEVKVPACHAQTWPVKLIVILVKLFLSH